MSGGVMAPGSFLWLARHELFLAWRNRPQRGALRWLGFVFIAAWVACGCFIGWLMRDVPIPQYPPMLIGVLVVSMLSFTFMATQAMIGSQQTLYESGDLALLFTAPIEPRSVLLAKLLGIAGAIVLTYALLLLPIVLPVAALGHPRLFGVVALLIALALAAAATGLAITMLIVRIAGPRAARTVGKIVAALLGGSFFIVSQVMSHVDRSARGANAFTALFQRLRANGIGSEGWTGLPGRAAFGDPLAALFMLGLGIALFALAGAALQRRFLSGYQDGGAKLSRSTARGQPMARLFHAGLTRSIFAKEWRLLARDPALAFQLVLRLVYMAPLLLVAFGNGRHLALAPTLAFASVLVATQLIGSLAWLTVSAEDSPDLITVAPVIKDDIDTAKLLAAFAMAAPFALALPIAIAFHTIPGAIATLVMSAIGGGLSGMVELQFGKPGQRANFAKRRQSGSFVSGILNLIISFAFGSVAGVLVYFLS
jgi:ABC-2 type transport system permease protein